jgi:ABC-2 type transport system ATP-binding protein
VTLADDSDRDRAQAIVDRFGGHLPGTAQQVAVRLRGGAAALAPVVRALDEAGVGVAALDVAEPTLDDVFLAKTGRTLTSEDE